MKRGRARGGARSGGVGEDDIRRIALALPQAYEKPSYERQPSWRTKARMFTWIRRDLGALVVWVDSLDAKEGMLAAEPALFFTTEHYDGYPILLARLDLLDEARARALVTESWRVRAPASLRKQWEAELASPERP